MDIENVIDIRPILAYGASLAEKREQIFAQRKILETSERSFSELLSKTVGLVKGIIKEKVGNDLIWNDYMARTISGAAFEKAASTVFAPINEVPSKETYFAHCILTALFTNEKVFCYLFLEEHIGMAMRYLMDKILQMFPSLEINYTSERIGEDWFGTIVLNKE